MPRTETDTALERLVHHALEVMCFAEAERLPSLPTMGTPVEVSVDFSGGRTGRLQLDVDAGAAHALSAAFLGVEAGDPSATSETAAVVQELAHVLAGRLVTSLDPAVPFEAKRAATSWEPETTIGQAFRVCAGTLRITLQMS
ncbi:MAG TPA: hypothetical protein VGK64_24000 [Bryobacteraceae bacterium]